MEGQTGKALSLAEELEGPGRAVALIAHHGMTGEASMAPDLMLSAGQKLALDEGVVGASAKNPKAGFARDAVARAFGNEAATCFLDRGQVQSPQPSSVLGTGSSPWRRAT